MRDSKGQAQLYASLVHLRHHHVSDHGLDRLKQTILGRHDGDLGAPCLQQPGQLDADVTAADDRFPLRLRAAMTWAQRLKRFFGIDIETCPADWEARYAARLLNILLVGDWTRPDGSPGLRQITFGIRLKPDNRFLRITRQLDLIPLVNLYSEGLLTGKHRCEPPPSFLNDTPKM